MKTKKIMLFCSLAVALTTGLAVAGPIPTLVVGTPAITLFEASNSIDTVANKYYTDYAAAALNTNGLGLVNLDFTFAAPMTFTSIVYTDRTTSGGAQGVANMSTIDFASQIAYLFYSNSGFTTQVGSTVVVNRTAPIAPADYLAFTTTTPIANLTAQYVRFEILQYNNGVNTATPHPGAANFDFTAVPEPSTGLLLGMGLLAGFVSVRRRSSKA